MRPGQSPGRYAFVEFEEVVAFKSCMADADVNKPFKVKTTAARSTSASARSRRTASRAAVVVVVAGAVAEAEEKAAAAAARPVRTWDPRPPSSRCSAEAQAAKQADKVRSAAAASTAKPHHIRMIRMYILNQMMRQPRS